MALRQTHDYQTYFDPKAYLAQRFSTKNGEIEDRDYQAVHPFFMECHHGFYSKYHQNWDNQTARVLEYGGGPVVYYLSCAAPYVREIVFAEYLESCRAEVQLWREKDPASHDWTPYFRSATLQNKPIIVRVKKDSYLFCIGNLLSFTRSILYKYHHSTKLYQKISRVCCRLYCYECAARVTMSTATNEWCFFRYSLVLWW